ncbi:protein takeout-like [Hetaerina americana]|uniref:protein takeout-like n=1 Tax=Hetaerina americana TaxID=62018 RepID=UPI003A7F60F7
MEFAVILVFSVLLFSTEGAVEKSLVKKLNICSSSYQNYNECFRGAIESAFRVLKDGDRSLGIVPIDPMFVPEMGISTVDGPVGLNLKFINCTHNGISTVKVLSAEVSPDKQRYNINMTLDTFNMNGPYEASGRILVLPISGKGICNITLYDSKIDWMFHGNPVKRGGKTYLEIDEYKVRMIPNGASIYLGNLFNGEKVLGETTNRFLNENSRDVILELAPDLNEALSRLHQGLAQRIMNLLPLEDLFP